MTGKISLLFAIGVLGVVAWCCGSEGSACHCTICCDTTGSFQSCAPYWGFPTEGEQKVLVVFARVKGDSCCSSWPCSQQWPVDQDLPDYASSFISASADPDSFLEPGLSDYYWKMSCGKYIVYGDYYPSAVETDYPQWSYNSIAEMNKEVIGKVAADSGFSLADFDVSPDDGFVDMVIVLWRRDYKGGYAHPMLFYCDTLYAWDGTGVIGEYGTHVPYARNLTDALSIEAHEHWHHFGMGHYEYVGVYGVATGYSNRGMTWSAPEREVLGWLDSTVVIQSDTVGLELPESNLSGAVAKVYVRNAPEDSVEYFLIENRQRKDWYSMDGELQRTCRFQPGTGLLIWHIDRTKRPEWDHYSSLRKEVDLESASGLFRKPPWWLHYIPPDSVPDPDYGVDGLDTLDAPGAASRCDSFDFFSGEWNNAFTPYTNPNTNTYYYNSNRPGALWQKYEQSIPTGVSITNIRIGEGDSYLFDVHMDTPVDTVVHDTDWAKWVMLNGDLNVSEQVTLTVAPGATVSAAPDTDFTSSGFDTARVELRAIGKLVAKGTENDPVTFRAAGVGRGHSPTTYDWRGVVLSYSGSDTLIYCDVGHAEVGVGFGVGSSAGSLTTHLRDLTVHDCNVGMNLGVGLQARIRVASCTIEDCPVVGVELSNHWRHVLLDSCVISENKVGIGASRDRGAPPGLDDTLVVRWNRIEDNQIGVSTGNTCGHVFLGDTQTGWGTNNSIVNDSTNVENNMGSTLMAEKNWWGSSPPDSSKFIGSVDFTPWLLGSPFGASQGQLAMPGGGQKLANRVAIFPNPSAGSVEFAVALDKETDVSVFLFDVQGRLVRALIEDKRLKRGVHFIVWDGKDLSGSSFSTGIYFCRVEAGEAVETTKIVLLR